jgi:glucose-6-phosphate dehydrogenase assembly protein OpcA
MTTLAAAEITPPENVGTEVPLGRIEAELARQFKLAGADVLAPVQLVRMSNLIIYCDCDDHLCRAESVVPAIIAHHPARVLLLLADPADSNQDVTASVLVRQVDGDRRLVSEQITLRASGGSVGRLPFAVRGLLVGDLPTNLWWACSTPPPLAGPILDDLAEHAEQVAFDSLGWEDPNRGVANASTWLGKFERDPSQGPWRVASDVNWRRLKYWRRLLSQALDPSSSPGLLAHIREVVIEHGPHAVTQAWQVASWLASRLGWTYQAGKLRPNVEIAFLFEAPQGTVSLRIDRLADGPSEIRRIRVSGGPEGSPCALEFASEGGDRLSVAPQGVEVAARTVTVQPQRIAELVARQLSDREPDPIFRESMKVAQQLARHVVG